MRTTGPCSARFYISLAYLSKQSNPLRLYAARYRGRGGKQPFHRMFGRIVLSLSFTARYNATPYTKTNADNRILPFPVNGNPSARFRKRNVTDVGKPTRTRPEARTKTKGEAEPLLLFWCGQQDLNLHEKCLIRSLVLCVCQFRHVRFLIPIKPRLPRNLTDIARL